MRKLVLYRSCRQVWVFRIAVLVFVFLGVFWIPSSIDTAYASPFGTRFVINPASTVSNASRFTVSVELYDQATGNKVFNSGVAVTLSLLRCPGYPSSCSVVIVDNNFANGVTSSGSVTFSNLNIATVNDDYYFAAAASGYSSGTSSVFDVKQATLRFTVSPAPTDLSTASRFSVQAVIRKGTGASDPIDTDADGINVRLGLYRCPGYPSSTAISPTPTR